jgi:hypothetical protein
VRGRDDDVGRHGEIAAVEDRQAGVGDVAVDRGGADDDGRAPARAGADELHGAADGDDLLPGGLEAEPPELADEVLLAVAAVVRHEGQSLAGGPQLRDGGHGPRRRLVADPDAAVEVEEHVVVARHPRRERHGRP